MVMRAAVRVVVAGAAVMRVAARVKVEVARAAVMRVAERVEAVTGQRWEERVAHLVAKASEAEVGLAADLVVWKVVVVRRAAAGVRTAAAARWVAVVAMVAAEGRRAVVRGTRGTVPSMYRRSHLAALLCSATQRA